MPKPYQSIVDGKRQLNEAGRAKFQEILTNYENPIKFLTGLFPGLLRKAARHKDREEIDQAALVGLTKALLQYRDDTGQKVESVVARYVANEVNESLFGPVRRTADGKHRQKLVEKRRRRSLVVDVPNEHVDFGMVDAEMDLKTITSKLVGKPLCILLDRLAGRRPRHKGLWMVRQQLERRRIRY